MTRQPESIVAVLGAFQAERAKTMEPAALKENERQRRHLDETADRSQFVAAGDTVPDFTLVSVDGETLAAPELLAHGPVLLVFFRFAGCPVCNIALPYYDRALRPGLEAQGVRLVAVSPQVPGKLQDIKTRHQLGFTVVTDPDNALARAFGIVFEPDETARAAALARGSSLPEVTGTGTWELPMPAVVLIDTDATVRFAEVTPDWLARSEAETILSAIAQTLQRKLSA